MSSKRPPTGYDYPSFEKRIEWINGRTGMQLDPKKRWVDEDLQGIIENPIGYVKMPVALCGPLLIDGEFANGEYIIPFSTVEGTLSISLSRGAYLCNLAGGVKAQHLKQEMPRTPVFFLPSLKDGKTFLQFIQENYQKIKAVAESTTRYGKLLKIDPYLMGRKVLLDFIFTTGDAAGQNMVTKATQAACVYIQEALQEILPVNFLIESNFSGDKNGCYRNMIKGRGHSATASVRISERVGRKIFKIDPLQVLQAGEVAMMGSSLGGVLGHNLHTANALTGLYLATGQDVACVAENAGAIFTGEALEDGSYEATITLPSITIGTIGGGTRLQDQNENLQMLGCIGENSSKKFAEIVAACALALEISLGLAIVKGDEFAEAHQKYGRKKEEVEEDA